MTGVPFKGSAPATAAPHLIGVPVVRYDLRVEPLTSADPAELVRWHTPSLTRYLGAEGSTAGR